MMPTGAPLKDLAHDVGVFQSMKTFISEDQMNRTLKEAFENHDMVMLAQLEIMTQNIKHTQQRTNEFAAKVEAVEISFQKHVEGKFRFL